jgi:hypothetical protein
MSVPPTLGVTGHRLISPEARQWLIPQLDAFFAGFPVPGRLVSALAEGADRLVAGRALAAGWSLMAVLPFPAEEYEADFRRPVTPGVSAEACVREFRDLLASAADVAVLPYSHAPDPVPGYEAAGEVVVERADMLIALWDGVENGPRAGTSATVRLARRRGVAIWWANTRHCVRPQMLFGSIF